MNETIAATAARGPRDPGSPRTGRAGCPEAAPAERAHSAWLASKRQELLAPAGAVLELSDMLLKDARERGHEAFLADLQRIHDSGRLLLALMDDVLDPATPEAGVAELHGRLRHDLRTPLTEILGLCEIWLEEAADQLLEGFAGDLQAIHALSKRLLHSLDDLFRFPQIASDPDIDLGDPSVGIIHGVLAGVDTPTTPGERGAVLVVDDSEVNRDVLHRRLTRGGHTVGLAADGRQALELLRACPFDVVLLDILMPGMNGVEVLEQLKADAALRNVPVIMVSAFNEIDLVARCIELGAEDYLPRPINSVLLEARINACLEKKRLLEEIERQRRRSDELLHVILPGEIVRELKATDAVRPRRCDDVAVMFCDIVGFTPYCDRNPPERVVPHLQRLIEAWEEIALRHEVEKIKTIGDAFMAAAGLLRRPANPVLACLRCGLEMVAACRALPVGWDLRVGIHVGPVVAGVIGRRQYLFDLWGDTVNTAARTESHGEPGTVTLSGAAWARVADLARGASRGQVSIKGKGTMEMVRFEGFAP
jgi:class 3 adenylate cyclase